MKCAIFMVYAYNSPSIPQIDPEMVKKVIPG